MAINAFIPTTDTSIACVPPYTSSVPPSAIAAQYQVSVSTGLCVARCSRSVPACIPNTVTGTAQRVAPYARYWYQRGQRVGVARYAASVPGRA
eukprot:3613497-Rhodomonas_salina.1